ncbi:hypothetical protein D3C71_1638710 [compost metagenome]
MENGTSRWVACACVVDAANAATRKIRFTRLSQRRSRGAIYRSAVRENEQRTAVGGFGILSRIDGLVLSRPCASSRVFSP